VGFGGVQHFFEYGHGEFFSELKYRRFLDKQEAAHSQSAERRQVDCRNHAAFSAK